MTVKNFKERFGGAALVTGASGGLGEEFARQLAFRGMDIVLVARTGAKLESLAKELKGKYGVNATVIVQDLTAADCAKKIKTQLSSKKISVGLLVNNAGYGSHGFLHTLDGENEIRMLELNCRTPLALTIAFAPEMVKRRKGGIIFLASIGAYQPNPAFANYGATKAYNLMLGESLWSELRPFGIDVIALSPGFTKTNFQEAGDVHIKATGGWAEPADVVRRCLNKIGKKPSTIYGFRNWLLAFSLRFTPRRLVIMISALVSKPAK
ncbi:MAG: SDR family oxidoreductase [Leptospira sp.]|nr:SDR family oxidoreductase [Leptospira sp.]